MFRCQMQWKCVQLLTSDIQHLFSCLVAVLSAGLGCHLALLSATKLFFNVYLKIRFDDLSEAAL